MHHPDPGTGGTAIVDPLNEPEAFPAPLKDLIDDYLSGLLDEARLAELEQCLLGDAEALRYFVRYARLHTDLHLEARAWQASDRALEWIGKLAQSSPAAAPNLAGTGRPPARRRVWALVTAAALLVSAGAGWWLLAKNAAVGRGPAIAWLVNAQNCRWSEGEATEDMRAGKVLHLERGLAEVRFECGARVVLEGPATLELLSGRSARLLHGRLTARAPGEATGFEIVSPQGKVIDLGTEFGIAVSEQGATEVYVFEGKVEAHAADSGRAGPVSLTQNQAARIAAGKVQPVEPGVGADQFVRAIVPLPVFRERQLRLTFGQPVEGSISDAGGLGSGLTDRLPGTGRDLPANDPNLQLDMARGLLELTTTRSDINWRGVNLPQGEYLGVRLSSAGFTGKEDFAVTAKIPNMPALENFSQFGLYAGTRSNRNIRGGLIKWGTKDPGYNTQFLVNNEGGRDTDLYRVGLLSPGTDLQLTLRRTGGKYSLTVENLTHGGASTLAIPNTEFLDSETDLFVGLFGANPYSDERKTLTIKEFAVTVWTQTPPLAGRAE
jgi:ferric-dicitrate binding protein FerR (iron transport regulator)